MEKAQAIALLMKRDEGVYSNDPRDPGGETVYGISRVHHPGETAVWEIVDRLRGMGTFPANLANFTPLVDAARDFYDREYWSKLALDALPPAVADDVFNLAVNMGPTAAACCLQRAVGVADDGRIGPVTKNAVAALSAPILALLFAAEALRFYTRCSGWPTYGKGWTNRLANLIADTAKEIKG